MGKFYFLMMTVLIMAVAFSVAGPAIAQDYKSPKFTAMKERMEGQPQPETRRFSSIRQVNDFVNSFPYKHDAGDVWLTPYEFFHAPRGRDCEDYAIAKADLLKRDGLAEKTEITLVYDKWMDNYHVVLVVNDSMVLDNENEKITKPAWSRGIEDDLRYIFIGRVRDGW